MQEAVAQAVAIDDRYAAHIARQQYGRTTVIEDVRLIDLALHLDDGGSFNELVRLTADGHVQALPEFRVAQSSYSEMLPGTVKAWHLHRLQADLWFVPPSHRLLVGLLDTRKGRSTCGSTMRLVMGAGKAQLLYIPAGVAHGAANTGGQPAAILYFVSAQFSIEDPDELRLPWDYIGAAFWQVERG